MKPSIRTSKRCRIRNAQFTTIIAWVAISCLADAGHALSTALLAAEEPRRPIDGIMDNSFLIEEAYNQDPGIVQHIFNAVYSIDDLSQPRQRRTDLSFTQEWPAYGQAHQLSYTVPYAVVREAGHWTDGIGDVLLNYRYQVFLNEKTLTAFAPRFSFVLPTGDEQKGFGSGTLGYQWNLPYSMTLGDRWFLHANAGLTFLPNAGEQPAHDLLNYNLGGSVIYCVTDRFNLMLEWIGNWNQSVTGSGEVERQFPSVISPGFRTAFNLSNGSQFVIGLAAPIGLTKAAPEIGAFVYLSFEHRMFGKEKQL
jgi:hypothetical protein